MHFFPSHIFLVLAFPVLAYFISITFLSATAPFYTPSSAHYHCLRWHAVDYSLYLQHPSLLTPLPIYALLHTLNLLSGWSLPACLRGIMCLKLIPFSLHCIMQRTPKICARCYPEGYFEDPRLPRQACEDFNWLGKHVKPVRIICSMGKKTSVDHAAWMVAKCGDRPNRTSTQTRLKNKLHEMRCKYYERTKMDGALDTAMVEELKL